MKVLEKKIYKVRSWRPSFEISIGAIVFSRTFTGVHYLLLRYPHGHWDFVKGHKEVSEDDIQTLRRELKEETGITDCAVLSDFQESIRFWYVAKKNERLERQDEGKGIVIFKKVVYYAAQVSQHAVVLSDEHIDFNWLSYDEALQKVTHENSKEVLRKAHSRIIADRGKKIIKL